MELYNQIFSIVLKVISVLSFYTIIYYVLGFFTKAKPLPSNENVKMHKYAIIICARNEKLVIGNLIESIKKQTYPKELLDVFVCADNCTDNTAEICRNLGCKVYERFSDKQRKGYALQYLFENIRKDYGIESYDGYIFFDADNLLKNDFVENMNRCFDENTGIINGYRNTKNFDTNFISSAYGIHFYSSTVKYHRPRRFLGLSTHIAGTGYLVSSRLLKNGWNCTCLTEDTEFSLKTVASGEKIDFCEQAEFFDEQPHNLRVSCRQRIRWAKGRLFAFFYNAIALIKGIFKNKKRKFSCYDMLFYGFPKSLFSFIGSAIYVIYGWILALVTYGSLKSVVGDNMLKNAVIAILSYVISHFFTALIVCIREKRHIHCSNGKLLLYCLTYFWFNALNLPLTFISLFMKVKWKPIKHDDQTRIEDLDK